MPQQTSARAGGSAHEEATNIAAPDPTLLLRDASFGYAGKAAVTGVTAALYPGEAVALIGPNGSGKSTLLGGLTGTVEQLGGELRVFGSEPREALSRIGLLPQADTRETELPVTAKQVVAMGLYRELGVLKPLGKDGRQRVQRALSQVGLGEHAGRLFGDLSGGQQQRVILARALVANPRLLLLDEPFNGLDRPNRLALLAVLRELRKTGVSVVVSTHDLEIAREACSHVLLLDREMIAFGEVAKTLTPENVAKTFHDTTVTIGNAQLTTRHERAGHQHTDLGDESGDPRGRGLGNNSFGNNSLGDESGAAQ